MIFTDADVARSIVDRFSAVAEAFPNRIAVVDDGGRFSYRDIDELSNGVARAIVETGYDRRLPVAIWLPTSHRYVSCIIGVLKAGGFYTSLHPTQPASRTKRILTDSMSVLALTDTASDPLLGKMDPGLQIIRADVLPASSSSVGGGASPGDPYCIYYTSGSTGEPKGVVHAHRSLLAHIRNYCGVMSITKQDRLSLLAYPNFAASASDIFGALLNGACVLPFDLLTQGLNRFIEWLEQNKITIYHTTPSLFRVMAGALSDPQQAASIRAVKLGGESVRESDIQLFDRNFNTGTKLVNGLGITEAAGNIAYYSYPESNHEFSSVVPVGYAVEDKHISILDQYGNNIKVGEIGEIVVSSANLAIGYWDSPALTARRFDHNREHGTTTFRTGDSGRMLAGGCLVHLGRIDRLIKIRGFRVYPEEIEHCVQNLDGVASCAVVALNKNDMAPSLRAFVLKADQSTLTHDQIYLHLRTRLPDYMVPASIEIREQFPALSSGKVDYAALRSLAEELAKAGCKDHAYVSPLDADAETDCKNLGRSL